MKENEIHIIERIQHNDKESFEKLFRGYYVSLCAYAYRYVESHDEAEEIVQDLFFHFWEKRHQLSLHTSLNAYLYKSTYTNCMEWIRKRNLRLNYAAKVQNEDKDEMMETQVEENEINSLVSEALLRMPKRVQQIFKMSRFEGLKYAEIAAKLSISVKTVEANMGKALKLFKHHLKDYVGSFLL